MNPVAFSLFGIDIMWYGIFISSGMLIGIILTKYLCKYRNVDYDKLFDGALLSLFFSIIGARAYYVIFEFQNYKDNLIEVFNIRNGGLAIHGGLIAAFATALIYTRIKKLDFLSMVDVAAPSIILAQAIGRWGNFFNSEAHGGPVSYEFIKSFPEFIQKGMYINGTYYHPTFLYESIWNLIVFGILIYMLKKIKTKGVVFFSYIGLYSLGRFFIEGLRTDSLMVGPLRIAQVVSLLGVATWILYLIYIRKKKE
ncbi:prolipoprotein diacylglyceryl transferase [Clostridium hydrogeniformans]|uniref:prolipoprotein diacylglyceryl transferase n=1 Tax=Clostridium hydrogeniformans TaxID=349933 RepID=UPI000487A8DA|nr:prolipoprotein diacylglyceryl transferase [Clostridium hydrogeniformans]